MINSIVLHYTGMETGESALTKMCNPEFEVSCHYAVEENGDIFRLVDEEKKAWHAGVSSWREQENINVNSIGIEIINKGHEFGYTSFPRIQTEAFLKLCIDINKRHNIDQRWVVGHSDIAPNRKEDPGELFPWKILADNGIGLWHNDDVHDGNYDSYMFTNTDIINVKKQLAEIGYYIHPSDNLDKQFKDVLTAFYRRFFPERILIQEDKRYPKNIHLDGKAINLISSVAEIYKQV